MIFYFNGILLCVGVYAIFTAGQLSKTTKQGMIRYLLLAALCAAHFLVFKI